MITPGKLASTRAYTGKVIDVDVDQVRFPDGSLGEIEMIRHPGASAIVPIMTDPQSVDPEVLLIRQYRYAATSYLYEIPAGRREVGETAQDCAIRELKEETGCTARQVERLTSVLTTPGFTDERIHLFIASGLEIGETNREPDEFMELRIFPLSAALKMVETGEISDAKTALSLLYVAYFRAKGKRQA